MVCVRSATVFNPVIVDTQRERRGGRGILSQRWLSRDGRIPVCREVLDKVAIRYLSGLFKSRHSFPQLYVPPTIVRKLVKGILVLDILWHHVEMHEQRAIVKVLYVGRHILDARCRY